jgi:hypothetical protein
MEKFRNTVRLTTAQLNNIANVISEGQSYFDIERNILYRDMDNKRFALAEVFKVDDLGETGLQKLRNSLIVNKKLDNSYELIYVRENGSLYPMGSGGGGSVVYDAGNGININLSNVISIKILDENGFEFDENGHLKIDESFFEELFLLKETENWVIQNQGVNSDFKIIQKDFNDGVNPPYDKPIIIIYKTMGPDSPNPKISINGKTTISELDFGS